LKKVYTARSLADVHLLKGLLEGIGIEAEVQGEQAFQITGQVPSKLTSPTVWIINDDDFEKAEELVASFRESEIESSIEGSPWRCSCGEENEGQFTECWSCGKSKPNFGKGER
jgi:hypothetical protein